MNKFFSVLLVFAGVSFAHATDWIMGDQWFSMVEKDYKEGKYDSFLLENKERYSNEISNYLEAPVSGDTNIEPKDQDFQDLREEQEKNEALTEAVLSKYPRSLIHDIVDSANRSDSLYKESGNAFNAIESGFKTYNGSYDLSAVDHLQKIINEYGTRQALVFIQFINNENAKDFADAYRFIFQAEAFQLVIQLEKYRLLMDAVQGESNDLQAFVFSANEGFRKAAAAMHDSQYLITLGLGQRLPENACEEEMAAITKKQIDFFTDYFGKKFNHNCD